MPDDTLEAFVEQLLSLDRDRERVALSAFQQLSELDRELWEMAMSTFDSEETAAGWLSRPVYSLGSEIPLVLVVTGKREDVINCLGQIQHGIFA